MKVDSRTTTQAPEAREKVTNESNTGPVHPKRTARNCYSYFFYVKHHRPANTADAQWIESLSHDEEFGIFDGADLREVFDSKGNYYGISTDADGSVLELGTEHQAIAEFPLARPGQDWHGYPLWPLDRSGANRRKLSAPSSAIKRMVDTGWLDERDAGRLIKGKHV